MTEKTETELSGNEKRFFELVKKAEPTIEDIQEINNLIIEDDIDPNKITNTLSGAPAIVFLAKRLNNAIEYGNEDLELKFTEIIKIFLNSPKVDVNQQYERDGKVYNTFVLLHDNEELRSIMLKNEKFDIDRLLYDLSGDEKYKFELFDLDKERNKRKKEFNPFKEVLIKNGLQQEKSSVAEEKRDIFLEAYIIEKIAKNLKEGKNERKNERERRKKWQNEKNFFDLIKNYDKRNEDQNLIITANEIKNLISGGFIDINQKNEKGSTFLNEAIKYNRETIIEFLLKQPDLKINESLEIDGKIYNPFLLVYGNENLMNKFLEREDFDINVVISLLKNDGKQIGNLEGSKREEVIKNIYDFYLQNEKFEKDIEKDKKLLKEYEQKLKNEEFLNEKEYIENIEKIITRIDNAKDVIDRKETESRQICEEGIFIDSEKPEVQEEYYKKKQKFEKETNLFEIREKKFALLELNALLGRVDFLAMTRKNKGMEINSFIFNSNSISRPNSYTARVDRLEAWKKPERQADSLDSSQQDKKKKSKIEEKSDELSEKEKFEKLSKEEKKRLLLCNDFITLENKFKDIKKNLETLKKEEISKEEEFSKKEDEIKKIENKIEKVREKIEQKVENNKSGYKTKKLENEMSKITEAIVKVESKFNLGKQKGSQQIE